MENPELLQEETKRSPRWTNNTKLIVALGFFAIFIWLLARFQFLLGPSLIAIIIPYLLHPLVSKIHRRFKLSWKLTVFIIYIILLGVLIGLLVWGGFSLAEQLAGLGTFIGRTLNDVPNLIDSITNNTIQIGPWEYKFDSFVVENLVNELVKLIQPIFSNLGSVVGSIAGGTAKTVGWAFFIIFVSFFILIESNDGSRKINLFRLPGYNYDVKRLGEELSLVWSSFLRGQLLVVLIATLIYTALLGGLGVRYFYALALLAGFARFIPYAGAWITWISYGLVTYFQGANPFGLQPIQFVILVLAISMLTDLIIDNFINTRVMANTLKVHPAAVLTAAIAGATIFGIVGVLFAAPVLATLKLFFVYGFRKMFDLDPWEGIEHETKVQSLAKLFPFVKAAADWLKNLFKSKKRKV